MYTVQFDPNGSALKVDIQFKGNALASYNFTLWGNDTNAIVMDQSGNNLNSQDDNYSLPVPVEKNDGRLIDVLSTIKNPDDNQLKAIVNIRVYQGNKKIADFSETETIAPKKTALNEMFIHLTAQ